MIFFWQIQLLDKPLRRTLTKTTLDHLAHNNMVRRVDHYNGVKYVPSTTNNPFSEKQSYKIISGVEVGGPTDLLMLNVTV